MRRDAIIGQQCCIHEARALPSVTLLRVSDLVKSAETVGLQQALGSDRGGWGVSAAGCLDKVLTASPTRPLPLTTVLWDSSQAQAALRPLRIVPLRQTETLNHGSRQST